jgi:hypothetical protein
MKGRDPSYPPLVHKSDLYTTILYIIKTHMYIVDLVTPSSIAAAPEEAYIII